MTPASKDPNIFHVEHIVNCVIVSESIFNENLEKLGGNGIVNQLYTNIVRLKKQRLKLLLQRRKYPK